MIRISKLADYGIVLMTHMSARPLQVWSARSLSADTQVPLPTAGKVLKALARAGLLQSQRGAAGGYVLARAAREISVSQMLAAIDGPVTITECSAHVSLCEIEECCPVRRRWMRINEAVAGALAGLTLAEMAAPIPRREPRPVMLGGYR